MKGSEFTFDYVRLLYYKCHKKSQLWWIKKQKVAINPID